MKKLNYSLRCTTKRIKMMFRDLGYEIKQRSGTNFYYRKYKNEDLILFYDDTNIYPKLMQYRYRPIPDKGTFIRWKNRELSEVRDDILRNHELDEYKIKKSLELM